MNNWQKSISKIKDEHTAWRFDFTKYLDQSTRYNGFRFFWELIPMITFVTGHKGIAWTDKDVNIFLNIPHAKVPMDDEKWEFIYYHECLHQMYETFAVEDTIKSELGSCNHDLLNVASDVVINDYVKTRCNLEYPTDGLMTPEYIKEKFGVEYDRKTDDQYALYMKLKEVEDKIVDDPLVQQMRENAPIVDIDGGGDTKIPKTVKLPTTSEWKKGSKEARKAINDILQKYCDGIKKQSNGRISVNDTLTAMTKAAEEIEKLAKGKLKPTVIQVPPNESAHYVMNSAMFIGESDDTKKEISPEFQTYEQGWDYAVKDVLNQISKMIQGLMGGGGPGGGGGTDDNEPMQQEVPENDPSEEQQFLPQTLGGSGGKGDPDEDDKDSKDLDHNDVSDMNADEAADEAQNAADKAKDNADGAQSSADSAQQNADSAASDAESAKNQHGEDSSEYKKAKSKADKAQKNADKAKDAAKKAKDAADKAQDSADKAKDAASKGDTDGAKDNARDAQKAADEAADEASKAEDAANGKSKKGSHNDVSNMSADEAADEAQDEADQAKEMADGAQEAADNAQRAADSAAMDAERAGTEHGKDSSEYKKAKSKADKAQKNADKAKSAAKKAGESADQAQDAADAAKDAADKGDTDGARNNAKKAQKAADKTADEAAKAASAEKESETETARENIGDGEENVVGNANEVNWESSSRDKGWAWSQEMEDNIQRYAEKLGDMTSEDAKNVIKKFARSADGALGEFVRKCVSSEEKNKKGIIVQTPMHKRNVSWAEKFSESIKNTVKQYVKRRTTEWYATYRKPNRRQGVVKDDSFLKKGKMRKKDKLTISVAFYIDISSSMDSSSVRNIFDYVYKLNDKIYKQYKGNEVVEDTVFDFYSFNSSVHKEKRPNIPRPNGTTLPLLELIKEIEKLSFNHMINVIITDAEMGNFPTAKIKAEMKSLPGNIVFITDNTEVVSVLSPLMSITTFGSNKKFDIITVPHGFKISDKDFKQV